VTPDDSREARQIALLESFSSSPYTDGKTGVFFDKARVRRLFQECSDELLRTLDQLAADPIESQAVQIGLVQVLIDVDEIATPARKKLVYILKHNLLGDIVQYNLADVYRSAAAVEILAAQPVLCPGVKAQIWRSIMEGKPGLDRHGDMRTTLQSEKTLRQLLLRRDNEMNYQRGQPL
jgi:hypothetical protein